MVYGWVAVGPSLSACRTCRACRRWWRAVASWGGCGGCRWGGGLLSHQPTAASLHALAEAALLRPPTPALPPRAAGSTAVVGSSSSSAAWRAPWCGLVWLDLWHADLDDSAMHSLAAALHGPLLRGSLQVLSFDAHPLSGANAWPIFAAAVVSAAAPPPPTGPARPRLASAASSSSTSSTTGPMRPLPLRRLKLGHDAPSSEACAALACALRALPGLDELDLR